MHQIMDIILSNGYRMPMVGYGTWQTANMEDHIFETTLDLALEAGYRHFDTAWGYRNEAALGRVIKRWLDSGKVMREELFITSKLPPQGHHPDRVERFLLDTLKDLQLDYIDLYLVHQAVSVKVDEGGGFQPGWDSQGNVIIDTSATLEESWKKLEEQVRFGRCRSIGLSNYSIQQVERICKSAEIMPVNHQIELNAFYPRKQMRKLCAQYGIAVSAFAPLGSPGRRTYKAYIARGADRDVPVPPLLTDPTVQNIANKHRKTPGQVLLRFLVQQGVSVLPKSVKKERIETNFDVFSFCLDNEDMVLLDLLDQRVEGGTWGFDLKKQLRGIEKHPEFALSG